MSANPNIRRQVRRLLANSILGRMRGAQVVEKSTDYKVYRGRALFRDVLAGLGSIGIAPPILASLAGSPDPPEGNSTASFEVVWDLPLLVQVPLWIALVGWVGLLVYALHKKLGERGPLFETYAQEIGKVHSALDATLQKAEPLEDLAEIQGQVREITERYFSHKVIDWTVPPKAWQPETDQWADELCELHGDSWAEIPDPAAVQQRRPE